MQEGTPLHANLTAVEYALMNAWARAQYAENAVNHFLLTRYNRDIHITNATHTALRESIRVVSVLR